MLREFTTEIAECIAFARERGLGWPLKLGLGAYFIFGAALFSWLFWLLW